MLFQYHGIIMIKWIPEDYKVYQHYEGVKQHLRMSKK